MKNMNLKSFKNTSTTENKYVNNTTYPFMRLQKGGMARSPHVSTFFPVLSRDVSARLLRKLGYGYNDEQSETSFSPNFFNKNNLSSSTGNRLTTQPHYLIILYSNKIR
jgi:hypothetical protein